jgi:hypothetical protein
MVMFYVVGFLLRFLFFSLGVLGFTILGLLLWEVNFAFQMVRYMFWAPVFYCLTAFGNDRAEWEETIAGYNKDFKALLSFSVLTEGYSALYRWLSKQPPKS